MRKDFIKLLASLCKKKGFRICQLRLNFFLFTFRTRDTLKRILSPSSFDTPHLCGSNKPSCSSGIHRHVCGAGRSIAFKARPLSKGRRATSVLQSNTSCLMSPSRLRLSQEDLKVASGLAALADSSPKYLLI